MLLSLPLLDVPEYAWICLYKHDSEYALGPKYAKILNTANFWIWQEYALTEFWISLVLNMLGFWIWQGYAWF